jgi:hypothetical protein
MRIVPFSDRREVRPGDDRHVELEAALDGKGEVAAVDYWRGLRADVRRLVPAMSPEFERELRERLLANGARQLRQAARPEGVGSSDVPALAASAERRLSSRGPGWLFNTGPRRAAVSVAMVAAVLLAVLAVGPLGLGRSGTPEAVQRPPSVSSSPAFNAPSAGVRAARGASKASPAHVGGDVASSSASAGAPAAGVQAGDAGRVEQRAATLNLSASASEVQVVADRVARLATNLGGFVQSSQVQVLAPQEGTSHAELELRLPSAKLMAALDALGQLAPVRSESQSLQDITNAYDAARRRLGDATAERQALLRALARASTEGEIDSLRERLSQTRRVIAEDELAFRAVAQHASTSEVEVTVLGDTRAASEGLTLRRGLREARKVLVVTVTVLMIALAILAPLAILLFALVASRRAWLRYRRERVLDAR